MPINIDLGHDYVLTSDTHQFILNKRKSSKGGDVYLDALSYHMSFESFLKSYTHTKLVQCRSKSFEEFSVALAKLHAEIKSIGDIFRAAAKSYVPEEGSVNDESQDQAAD